MAQPKRLGSRDSSVVGIFAQPTTGIVKRDHPVTKMYVKGGRGGVCNIHFTVVHFFYWGILAYNFQRAGGSFF